QRVPSGRAIGFLVDAGRWLPPGAGWTRSARSAPAADGAITERAARCTLAPRTHRVRFLRGLGAAGAGVDARGPSRRSGTLDIDQCRQARRQGFRAHDHSQRSHPILRDQTPMSESQPPSDSVAYLLNGLPSLLARRVLEQVLCFEPRARAFAIVHVDDFDHAERLLAQLESSQRARVELLRGDLTTIDFGLSGREYLSLAAEVRR